jgi:hypothetical protein
MNELVEQDLIEYVTNQKTGQDSIKRIYEFCKLQQPISITLYRGHKKSREIRNSSWYSASKLKRVAKEEFAGTDCCVFKINVVNVPTIDINNFVGDKINDYVEEEECIFLGGGTFYKNNVLTEEGFFDLGNGEFECWYTFPSATDSLNIRSDIKINSDKLKDIFNQIDPDEYEFIESPDDIVGFNLNALEKQQIYDKILKMKPSVGGNKKRKTRRNKRKSKRHNKSRQMRRNKSKTRYSKLHNKRIK